MKVEINRITNFEETTWMVLVNGKIKKTAKTKATCKRYIDNNYQINEMTGLWENKK